MTSDASPRACVRCRSPLSEGSGYCVACGFQNIDLAARSMETKAAADQRIERFRLIGKLIRMSRGFFR